ncbi:Mut7-C RNAse domain-containing protein [Pontibacter sp. 13R65]|uniref:Mut7-C RNAse domain-containing protein n=1 Tax=Pontibacter sp. 13R65 TaxID=3127458 RepID=UPI00301BC565
MEKAASFYFYGSLNDFLPASYKSKLVPYTFTGAPAVKDAIEALGVPHPEVQGILVNDYPVDFKYQLQQADWVEVYPASAGATWPAHYSIQAPLPTTPTFILDVHLGKLAKSLRLLGFDTLYQNDFTDSTIAQLASEQHRVVLTRDIGLLKHKSIQWGYWLRSQHLEEQLTEVLSYFRLASKFSTFSRCLVCNSLILPVPKAAVLAQLPAKTKLYFDEFYQCPTCQRVYWKGSHYERMQEFVQRLKAGEAGSVGD